MTESILRLMMAYVVVENSKLSFIKALKASFLLVFATTLIYRLFDQYITKQIEIIMRSQDGIQPSLWIWAGLSLVISLVFPVLTTLVSAYALKNNSVKKITHFIRKNFELSVLETLRAWGVSFLWGLLFIIPGLIRMSYYYLTMFVVMFSPQYAEGKEDALDKSAELSKLSWIKLNLLVTLFYFLIPIVTSSLFDEYMVFEKHPVTAMVYSAFEAILILLFNYYVLKMFLKHLQGDSHGTDVQLATN